MPTIRMARAQDMSMTMVDMVRKELQSASWARVKNRVRMSTETERGPWRTLKTVMPKCTRMLMRARWKTADSSLEAWSHKPKVSKKVPSPKA